MRQLANFSYRGEVTVRDKKVDAISGQWKSNPDGEVSGTFEMYLGPEGDLVRFVMKQTYAVENQTATVVCIWDADLKINVDIPDSIFKVR